MKTIDVYKLLLEASFEDTSVHRLNKIQVELCDAIRNNNSCTDKRIHGIMLVLDTVFCETIENNRELLPSLLPMFAIICGDRLENTVIGHAEWDVINTISNGKK